MNETVVTLIGNVATDVRSTTSQAGVPISSFRVASTTRRFERGKGWTDLDTLYVTVVCWRSLAENVAASLAKGDPVVVSGRLRMRQWTADDGRTGTSVELEAVTAGHDLNRGGSRFTRVRAREHDRPGRSEADRLADQVAREPVVPLAADSDGEVQTDGRPPAADPNPPERNTGEQNTGEQNTGEQNTGEQNTGEQNTGERSTVGPDTLGPNTVDSEPGPAVDAKPGIPRRRAGAAA